MAQASRVCQLANQILSVAEFDPSADDDIYSLTVTVEVNADRTRDLFVSAVLQSGAEHHFPMAANGLVRPLHAKPLRKKVKL